jgi:pimeloyl-ACP methyl ester carboxylesterase
VSAGERTDDRPGDAVRDLVLIPGTLCDARLFERQRRDLRRLCPGLRVTVVDLHRLRLDSPSAAQATIEAWSHRCLQDLPERFALAGFSLGGLIALQWLRLQPQRVQALALVASNAEGGSRRARRRSRAQAVAWAKGGADALMQGLMPAYFAPPNRRARHGPTVRAMARATPTAAARAQFTFAARRPAGHAALAASGAPVLVVSAARDRFCPRRLQRRLLASRPDARWTELRGCGHFLPLERPHRLSALLAHWLGAANPPWTGHPAATDGAPR